jgi:hypothetical protein
MQAQSNCTYCQDARTQDAPEAMSIFFPPEQSLVQMILSKEATELPQDSGYSTAPEAMVQFEQTSPSSHALASRLSTIFQNTGRARGYAQN